LKYKALFEEFKWPKAFPLPQTQFDTFLKRHHGLTERNYADEQPYTHIWYRLTKTWFKSDKNKEQPSADPTSTDHQRFNMLDQKIGEALGYEESRDIDMAYAAATGSEIEERLKSPVRLHDSANIGEDWRIDIKAEDIMERFWDVIALEPELDNEEDVGWPGEPSSRATTDILEEMGKVMEAAYYRYLHPQEAEREVRMVGVPDEDDDSTSDFGDNEEGDDSNDTLSGSEDDVEEDDLDATALQTDMGLDVEAIRKQLAESQLTTSETQASSQTLQGDDFIQ
jgi:hypothetical protein